MTEKIKNLQWHFQLLLMVGIATLLYLTVWYFVTSVTRAEVEVLNGEIAALQAKNEAARVATQRINEFRALYASKAVEYEELKVLLPEQREITNVLQGLQDNARDSRMIVMRFSPLPDVQNDVIMAKPVQIEVDSNFTNLREFFDKMAKLPRIVSISNFKIEQLPKQTSEKTIHALFDLTAYYATPEGMAPKPVPGQPGVPVAGQPAAPVAVTPPAK
ncbi:MAG: type 4a pilus biogenesis protein PilO [Pyrinomonadaceae bacterium]